MATRESDLGSLSLVKLAGTDETDAMDLGCSDGSGWLISAESSLRWLCELPCSVASGFVCIVVSSPSLTVAAFAPSTLVVVVVETGRDAALLFTLEASSPASWALIDTLFSVYLSSPSF